MQELEDFINETTSDYMHAVLKSGVFHYEFVRIIPFIFKWQVKHTFYLHFIKMGMIFQSFSLEEYFDTEASCHFVCRV